ncbi:MAG: RNA polymerase factor sigma-54 [Candidatus Pacebacteria bacterium]|nr:RNA polymerase factor sigma-54 [Candidatus Paceibacterota bacterium]
MVALSQKIDLRQSQSLVMTPQMQQAIKLLQLNNQDLATLVEEIVAENPLLELADGEAERAEPETNSEAPTSPELGEGSDSTDRLLESGELLKSSETAGENRDSDSLTPVAEDGTDLGYDASAFSGGRQTGGDESYSDDINDELAHPESLMDHIAVQIPLEFETALEQLIAENFLEALEPTGYLPAQSVEEIADRLNQPQTEVEAILHRLQGLDPAGIFARDLQECLKLQLQDRNHYDPWMERLLNNLPLVAARNLDRLQSLCGVSRSELDSMLVELRSLDPKPGLRFSGEPAVTVLPDLLMRQGSDGQGWVVELNPQTLPRVLVNRNFVTTINRASSDAATRSYLTEKLSAANWLVKTLEQRAITLLKVASEIIRRQDRFFIEGPQALAPLVLREVALSTELHESTISRVTTNKFMLTPRGMFELKYFFSASLGSIGGKVQHSAAAVKHRIKTMIEEEDGTDTLSDDQIVAVLRSSGIVIARRTVAKYREAMNIGSSVERRRGR